jgi:MinD-like ATPase involved in chromosome partitioning or flagellar assembly
VERVPVVLALTPVAERGVEHLLFGRDAVVEPRASAAEADELKHAVPLAAAAAVLVSPDLPGLTAAHCARVRACGLNVVGLASDSRERQELLVLGVDEVVEPGDSGEAFLAALRGRADEKPAARPGSAPADLWAELRADDVTGNLLAVIGSKGAPGASECAASLATLARERWTCVLVDLDALGGGLDLRLGVDPRQGSLLGLTRAVASGDGAIGELLERWLAEREGWPLVLVGPPDPEEAAAELARPGAVAATLRALASVHPLVVADVGFLLSEGAEAGATCRVHRAALVAADAVLLVLGAREEQLRAGLTQLDSLLELGIAPQRLRIAVNGAGGPAAAKTTALEQVITRQLGERRFALDAWLPWDGRALARAQRTGLPLAAARRRGPYARALARLLDELFLPLVPGPRERKLRLPPPRRREEKREEVALR